MLTKRILAGASVLVISAATSGNAATLLYQYNFDNQPATATTAVPNVGANGVLNMNTSGVFAPLAIGVGPSGLPTDRALINTGVNNTPTGSSLTGSNSVANGSTNIPLNGTTAGNGINTVAAPENRLNLGTLSQFTVTMWVRRNTPSGATVFPRLMMVGADGQDTGSTTDGFAIALNNNGIETRIRNAGGVVAASGGQSFTDNAYQFIAVSFDLAATNPYFSAAQLAASGGYNDDNTIVYRGTQTTPVAGFGAMGLNAGVDTNLDGNAFNDAVAPITPAGFAYLLNRRDLTRGLNGNGDDFRIYDGLLTIGEIEQVRLSAGGLVTVPEPASLSVLGLAGAALVRRRRA